MVSNHFTINFWDNLDFNKKNIEIEINNELERMQNYVEHLHQSDSLKQKQEIIENLENIISDIGRLAKKKAKQKDVSLLAKDVRIRTMIKAELKTIKKILNFIGTIKNLNQDKINRLNTIKDNFKSIWNQNESAIAKEKQIIITRLQSEHVNKQELNLIFKINRKLISSLEQEKIMQRVIDEKKYEYAASLLKLGMIEDAVRDNFLHVVIKLGDNAMLKILIDAGADVTYKDREGNTILSIAAELGNAKAVNLLINRGAEINSRNEEGYTPLSLAAKNGHLEIVKALVKEGAPIDQVNNNGDTPLSLGVLKNRLEVVDFLIEKGADIDHENNNKKVPLLLAIERGHLEMVKTLIENGAVVRTSKNEYELSATPLYIAAREGHKEIVEYLLSLNNTNVISPISLLQVKAYLLKGYHHDVKYQDSVKLIEQKLSPINQLHVEELLRRKKVGHTFNLKGRTQLIKDKHVYTIRLEGLYPHVWYPIIYKSLENFSNHYSDLLSLERVQPLLEAFAFTSDQKFSPDTVLDRIKQGLPTLIPTGYIGHQVILLIWGNYFVICNRGEESRTPLDTFQFNLEFLDIQTIQILLEELPQTDNETYRQFMFKELPERLDLFKSRVEKSLIKRLSLIKQ